MQYNALAVKRRMEKDLLNQRLAKSLAGDAQKEASAYQQHQSPKPLTGGIQAPKSPMEASGYQQHQSPSGTLQLSKTTREEQMAKALVRAKKKMYDTAPIRRSL
jgi:hypothetical protein